MSVEALKSALITNLDAALFVPNTIGEGAPGPLWQIGDYVTVSASASATSTYRLVRFPTNAKVKSVVFESEAMVAGAFNLSLYWSDSTVDGTQPQYQGLIVATYGDQLFASDIDCASAVVRGDKTNESGNYTLAKRNVPMWRNVGFTADPGGFFDLVAVVHTTAVTTGAAKMGAEVHFVM